MRFLIIVLLFVVSNLAQNVSDNAEAKRKTFGQEKYKKKDGFVNVAHSIHGAIRNATSGKKFWKYEMSRSISEMVDKLTNGSGDIIVLKNNLTSPQVIGWGIGIIFSFVISIAVYIILMVYFCGWCCAQCCQDLCCKSQGPVCSLCCWDDKKGTKTFCKICTLVTYVIFSLILLLFVAVMIYGSFIVTKPLDEIKEGLVSINTMANDLINFAQASIDDADPGPDQYTDADTTKSLIRPILVTLYEFQNTLNNDPNAISMYTGLKNLVNDDGYLATTIDGMKFGHDALSMIDTKVEYDVVFLTSLIGKIDQYGIISDIDGVKSLINGASIQSICKDIFLPKQMLPCPAGSPPPDCPPVNICPPKTPEDLKKTKVEWIKDASSDLKLAYGNVNTTEIGKSGENIEGQDANNFNKFIVKISNLGKLKSQASQFNTKFATATGQQFQTAQTYLDTFNTALQNAINAQTSMVNALKAEIDRADFSTVSPSTRQLITNFESSHNTLIDTYLNVSGFIQIVNGIQTVRNQYIELDNTMNAQANKALDSIKTVNQKLEDSRNQVKTQTGNVGNQLLKYENYVQDKIIDRYYDKYMEESPYKLKSLIKSLAILFGILLIFWFALIVIQAFISIFCAKSGLLGCCICSEFTILAVFGIVLIVLSLIACILGDVTKFIYGPDAIGYLTGNRILRKGSSALSQLNITQPEVKDILIYYYGPTEAEAEHPVRTPLSRFVNDKIQKQPMVDEVFPRGDESHSMVIQDIDSYQAFMNDHPEYSPTPDPTDPTDPSLPLIPPQKEIKLEKNLDDPYYCNSSLMFNLDGSLNLNARICLNVLAETTQNQMDNNKDIFWKKFDGFIEETIGYAGYESISSTGYFLVDTIFITMEGGFMYFYIGMIIVFLFSIPHIICMSSGRTYWTKYVPRPKEEKKREGYKVEEMDEIEVEDDIQEEEQEVLTTNDSGQLVVMVVKTKKGQAQQMRPQERDRENKMLDDLFRNDNTEAIIHPQQGQGGTSSRNRNQPGSVQSVGFNAAIQPWVYSQQMNPEDAQLMSYTDNGFVPQPDPLDTYGMDGVDDGFNVINANQNAHKQQGFYPKGPYHTGYEGD